MEDEPVSRKVAVDKAVVAGDVRPRLREAVAGEPVLVLGERREEDECALRRRVRVLKPGDVVQDGAQLLGAEQGEPARDRKRPPQRRAVRGRVVDGDRAARDRAIEPFLGEGDVKLRRRRVGRREDRSEQETKTAHGNPGRSSQGTESRGNSRFLRGPPSHQSHAISRGVATAGKARLRRNNRLR